MLLLLLCDLLLLIGENIILYISLLWMLFAMLSAVSICVGYFPHSVRDGEVTRTITRRFQRFFYVTVIADHIEILCCSLDKEKITRLGKCVFLFSGRTR